MLDMERLSKIEVGNIVRWSSWPSQYPSQKVVEVENYTLILVTESLITRVLTRWLWLEQANGPGYWIIVDPIHHVLSEEMID